MAGWVRLNAYSHTGKSAFFFGYGTFGTPGGVYALQMDGATLKFSQWDQELVGPDLELNRWYHVAVTNTGTAVTIYVDGDPAVSGTLPLNTQVGTPFIIGSETAPAGRHLNGYLDEIMVVNRALTPLEVKSLYQFGGVVDVPWLAVSPLSGAIPAGGSLPLVVQLIATATPPGLYRTNLVVWSSPGGERLTIPIELRIWNTIYLPLANN
jgi:hypothetical protein